MMMNTYLKTATLSLGLSLMMSAAYADTYFYNTPSTEETQSSTTDTSSQELSSSASLSPSKDAHDQFVKRYQTSHS